MSCSAPSADTAFVVIMPTGPLHLKKLRWPLVDSSKTALLLVIYCIYLLYTQLNDREEPSDEMWHRVFRSKRAATATEEAIKRTRLYNPYNHNWRTINRAAQRKGDT